MIPEELPKPEGSECQIIFFNILLDGLSQCGAEAVARLPIVVYENTPDPRKMGPRMGFVATDVCSDHLDGLRINKGGSP